MTGYKEGEGESLTNGHHTKNAEKTYNTSRECPKAILIPSE